MKNLVLVIALALGSTALAGDAFEPEIICSKVSPGLANDSENGLVFTLSSNATAWVKRVEVVEYGLFGQRQIALIQVPLQPEIIEGRGFVPNFKMIYRGQGLVLEMHFLRLGGKPILNSGHAELTIPGRGIEHVPLDCKSAR